MLRLMSIRGVKTHTAVTHVESMNKSAGTSMLGPMAIGTRDAMESEHPPIKPSCMMMESMRALCPIEHLAVFDELAALSAASAAHSRVD